MAKVFLWLMGAGILVLINAIAIMLVAARIGAYLAVAAAGILAWINAAFVFASMAKHIRKVRESAYKAGFEKNEYVHIGGLLISALLMVMPGPVTAIVGWVIYIAPFRLIVGNMVYKRFEQEIEQVHQHLAVDDR